MSAPQSAAPRIVAGVDGSPVSIAALRWAIRQAAVTGGTVEAVIAWEFPVVGGSFGWAPTAPFDDTDYSEIAAKTLNAAVTDASPPPGVTVNQIVREGSAAQVLLNAAKDADLLVVGNRGHGGLADALIGSVSVRCLHHATCPVVIIRTPAHRS
jgi:nucleotide-binding universal stress UspA family protein